MSLKIKTKLKKTSLKQGNNKLKRPCSDCDKYFLPNGVFSKKCDKCKRIAYDKRKEANKKEYGDRTKKIQRTRRKNKNMVD